MSLVQRCIMETVKNHLFFATLTYNEDMIPRLIINQKIIKYARYQDLNGVIRRLRKYELFPRPFRYFAVSELGSKRGRPHFHVLFSVPKYDGDDFNTCLGLEQRMFKVLLDNWTRRFGGSSKFPVYLPLCTFQRRIRHGKVSTNFDLHYVNENYSMDGSANVAFYVLKYMLKPSTRARRLQQALRLNLEESEYNRYWSIIKPRYWKSHNFGLGDDPDIQKRLRSNIERCKKLYPYPVFVHPLSGATFPLSRYYKGKGEILDLDLATYFAMEQTNRNELTDPNFTECRRHSIRLDFLAQVSESESLNDFLFE